MSFSWFGLALAHGSKCGFGPSVTYLYFCVSVFPTFAQVWMCQGFGGHWPMVAEAVTGSRGSHRPGLFPPTPSEADPCLPCDRNICPILQIYFAVWTNSLCNLSKYACISGSRARPSFTLLTNILMLPTNTLCNLRKYILKFGQICTFSKYILQWLPKFRRHSYIFKRLPSHCCF